jgi:hypothetical protein
MFTSFSQSLFIFGITFTCMARRRMRSYSRQVFASHGKMASSIGDVQWFASSSAIFYCDSFSLLLSCVPSSIIPTQRRDCSLRRRLVLLDLFSYLNISIYRVFIQDTNARATPYHLFYLLFTLASSRERMSQPWCVYGNCARQIQEDNHVPDTLY